MTLALQIIGVHMNTLIALVAAVAVCAACVMLIFHHDYEDGLLGRVGLSLIALASFATVIRAVDTWIDDLPLRIPENTMLLLWCGLTIFLCRHVWRFLRRSRSVDWRPAAK